ncbi:MarR family transcriptional regulator [Arthrobacter sp. PsM3]|uniref:MarR family transcriptional regulator n=1 Tax=Arthrobacter sp. PsM3 TaxID=3030531 RepID=UPI00263AC015|nr:MarR family transcriptional regulator [Arthrobacter sp. PsM3]MDN4643335.1 MarR family transcriptional regulator [Arthrobacter sp. PsM3]
MNKPIGYWVKRLDASLETLLDSTLSQLSLTRRQWQLLNALRPAPLTPTEVGDVLRPYTSADGGNTRERDMAALVRRRLVFLLDGRLALTGAGSALHAEAALLMEASRRELTAGIGADEYAIALSVLERMNNNADRLTAG